MMMMMMVVTMMMTGNKDKVDDDGLCDLMARIMKMVC